MINQVTLIGRLTADPKLDHTQGGDAYCQFAVAVDRRVKNSKGEREPDFLPCIVWRKPAENLARYTKKGERVGVEGRLRMNKYTDKNGNQITTIQVVADNVHFLGSNQGGQQNNSGAQTYAPTNHNQQPAPPQNQQQQQPPPPQQQQNSNYNQPPPPQGNLPF